MCNDFKSLKKIVPSYIFSKIERLSSDETEQLIMMDEFIERTAIMEYEGMQPRFIAEQNAMICVTRNFGTRSSTISKVANDNNNKNTT